MMKGHRAAACMVALAALFVVAGLGWGSGAAEAAEPVKIGVTVTQSPPGSVVQGTEVTRGLEIMRDLINEAGGVLNGRPIQLIFEDSQGLPERGRAAVEKLITADNVVAITGQHQSSVCMAEIEVVHRYDVPYVNVNCWADEMREKGYPQVFNTSNYNSRAAGAMAEVISAMGLSSVVAFAENTDWGIGQAELLGEFLREQVPGIRYEYHVLDREARDFTPAVLPLRRSRPDMVAMIMLPPAGYHLANQLYEMGIAPSASTWLFDGGGIADYPDFWDVVRDAGKYMLSFGLYHPSMTLTELGVTVREAYIQRHGGFPSRLVFQAADALAVLAEAIDNAGSTDSQAIQAALRETNLDGTRGTITFQTDREPAYLFQQWVDFPYVVFQFLEVDQSVGDSTLIMGPGVPLDTAKLVKAP